MLETFRIAHDGDLSGNNFPAPFRGNAPFCTSSFYGLFTAEYVSEGSDFRDIAFSSNCVAWK